MLEMNSRSCCFQLSLGYKVTLRTNLHAGVCADTLYQPFIFFTNKSSNCELKRLFCSEEGQIVSSNGTTSRDRECRCNYAHGYTYVTQPKNICSCIPTEEDCSCYRKKCSKTNILSPGRFTTFKFISKLVLCMFAISITYSFTRFYIFPFF